MWLANGRFAPPGRPRSSDCTDRAQPADGTPGPAGWSRVDGQAGKSTAGPYHWDGSKEQVGELIFNQPWNLMPQDFPPTWPFAIGPHGATGSSMAPAQVQGIPALGRRPGWPGHRMLTTCSSD